MKEITQTITCALPNFEGVRITFDLMASTEETDTFVRRMGGEGTHKPVVVKIEGWPAEFGDDPWSESAPVVFRAWLARAGWGQAMREWLENPLS